MNSKRTLIIGTGSISDYLLRKAVEEGLLVEVVPLSSFLTDSPDLSDFTVICLCGYDKVSLARNIKAARILSKSLRSIKYSGLLIFFNTHLSMLREIALPARIGLFLGFSDQYVMTKKIQAHILAKSGVRFLNIHIPAVQGLGVGFDSFLSNVRSTRELQFPASGNNHLYILEVSDLYQIVFNSDFHPNEQAHGKRIIPFTTYTKFRSLIRDDPVSLKATSYESLSNLPKFKNFIFIVKKLVKFVGVILIGSFRKRKALPSVSTNPVPIKNLGPERNAFYSLDFRSPEALIGIEPVKL